MARQVSSKPTTKISTATSGSVARDNMAALPSQLFYSTQIPVCLWFIWKKAMFGKSHAQLMEPLTQ
jgi:ABC-type glucose/galactose transport system permease subunit